MALLARCAFTLFTATFITRLTTRPLIAGCTFLAIPFTFTTGSIALLLPLSFLPGGTFLSGTSLLAHLLA